jgi:orotate phosphoribosyltransferase
MTPKEKAEELVNKFIQYTPADSHFEYDYAKECALIAVDEILSSGVDANYYFDKSLGYIITYQEYYQEVKQELEKI